MFRKSFLSSYDIFLEITALSLLPALSLGNKALPLTIIASIIFVPLGCMVGLISLPFFLGANACSALRGGMRSSPGFITADDNRMELSPLHTGVAVADETGLFLESVCKDSSTAGVVNLADDDVNLADDSEFAPPPPPPPSYAPFLGRRASTTTPSVFERAEKKSQMQCN